MEKLIELLNEFEDNRPMELPRQYRRKAMHTFKGGLVAISEYDDEMVDNSDLLVISKFNGFIKWLVDNDKIDFENQAMQYAKSDLSKFFTEWEDKNGMSDDYAMLLMLLAIQDEPIELLCSILK